MPGHFAFETDPNHPRNPFPGQSVERWSPEKLEQHRVVVDENGLLRNTDGSLFDTTGAKSHWTPDGGRAIFIMDRHGNIYASLEQERGRLHHSTLASGNPVTGAGELSVINGRLVEVTGNSGHYMPGRTNTQNVVDELARQGIDIRSITVEWIAPEGT